MTSQNRLIFFWFVPPSFSMNHEDSFSIESSIFKVFVVPIASWLIWLGLTFTMELLMQFFLEPTFLVFIGSKLSIYFDEWIHIQIMIDESLLMLYYTVVYEVVYRPYILGSYIIYIYIKFFSFFHLSSYPHPFLFIFFTLIANKISISFVEFMTKQFQLLQW